MKRTASRWIAAVSVLAAVAGVIDAARRPVYGGELHLEIRAVLRSLDPAEEISDPAALAAQLQLSPMVFETLVRLDERGNPQPWLATSWTHDTSRKLWVFTARLNVLLHDGSPWSPPNGVIEVPDDKPIEQILRDLSRPRSAVVVRTPDGSLAGTGPFRITRWDADKSGTLTAHDGYWGGRPYLDRIEVLMGRSLTDQSADLQLGKADVVEDQVTNLRRLKQAGAPVYSTDLAETLALQFDETRVAENVREAVALSIDRAALHDVILQRQGEVSAALLPRWLSGYTFLFTSERDVARARQIAPSAAPLAFSYDAQDAVMRPVGQRIEVNVREAGITLRPSSGAADVRLMRLPVTSRDAWIALQDLATLTKAPPPAAGAGAYDTERALLEKFRVIPLVQLPKVWVMSARVRDWPRLADAWIDPGRK